MSADRAAGDRLMGYFDAVCARLEAAGLAREVKLQLDPYDIADVMRESFAPPALRVFVLRMEPSLQAGGATDLELTLAVAAIAGREGRPDHRRASADLAAARLVMNAAAAIRQDPYFDTPKATAAELQGFRIAASETSNDKGLAIALLQFRAVLLGMIPEWSPIAAAMDAARPAGLGLAVNGATLAGGAP